MVEKNQISNVGSLLDQIGLVVEHYKEMDRVSGNRFNVFSVIGVERSELMHSCFIAELLSPEGSHGQGAVFLDFFFKQLKIAHIDPSTAKVQVEYNIGLNEGEERDARGGRLDIRIKDASDNMLVIENKIDAEDQPLQIVRYHNYLVDQNNCKNHNSESLLYMTLDGSGADKSSALDLKAGKRYLSDNEESDEGANSYECISYKKNILKWLEECQKESVNIPKVREGIAHYIELVKILTNQTLNKAMKDEIIDNIMQSPERVAAALEITEDVRVGVINKILEKFWNTLKVAVGNLGHNVACEKSFLENMGEPIICSEAEYGLYLPVVKVDDKHELFWVCAVTGTTNIFIGFTVCESDTLSPLSDVSDISGSPKYKLMFQKVKDYGRKYPLGGYWLSIRSLSPERSMVDMSDKDKLNKLVNEIATQADREIKELQSL